MSETHAQINVACTVPYMYTHVYLVQLMIQKKKNDYRLGRVICRSVPATAERQKLPKDLKLVDNTPISKLLFCGWKPDQGSPLTPKHVGLKVMGATWLTMMKMTWL